MSHELTTEVLIIGAGPVGLLTAIALADRGIRVKVIDQEQGPASQSYACALHPGTLQLLAQFGVAEKAISQGVRIEGIALYDAQRQRAQINVGAVGGDYPFVLALPQSALESLLLERLNRDTDAGVDWNHRLSTLETVGGKPSAAVDQLVITATGYIVPDMVWVVGKTIRVAADYVVGADGHRSHVRDCLGIEFERRSNTLAFEMCEFDTDKPPAGILHLMLGDGASNALWPLPGGRCRSSFQIEPPPDAQELHAKDRSSVELVESDAAATTRKRLQELLRQRAPWFKEGIGEIHWNTTAGFVPGLCRRFGNDRCWLVGDAAHETGPIGMQGLNLGMLDAAGFAANLHQVLRQRANSDVLERSAGESRQQWLRLLGANGAPRARANTDPWIKQNSERILSCLPASGGQLAVLLDQLTLDPA